MANIQKIKKMNCKELDAFVWMIAERLAGYKEVALEGSRLIKPEYSSGPKAIVVPQVIQDSLKLAVNRDKELRKGNKRQRPIW